MTADQAARLPFPLAPVTVVTGHYGVGKTNFALNLALDAAAAGYRVTLADMDVVNPYFRSNEYRDLLEEAGVRLIAPVFGHAGTSLDVPSVTGELAVAAAEAYRDETGRTVVIVDAGGDDVGALGFLPAYPESEITWEIAQKVADELEDLGANVILLNTRLSSGKYVIQDRVADAKAKNAQVYLSIHCNSSPSNSSAVGYRGLPTSTTIQELHSLSSSIPVP